MNNCEKYKPLLMGLIDKELTPEEAKEVNDHLIRCEKCREEFEELKETSEKIQTVSFSEPSDIILKRVWKSPYSRLTKSTGLLLVLLGWLSLFGYGMYIFFSAENEAVFPKIAIAAMIIGFVVLLASVLRERIISYKTDPYREVEK